MIVSVRVFGSRLLSEIEGGTSKVRFYRTSNALVMTVNAAWTPETTTTAVPTAPAGVWTADFASTPAAKYTLADGLILEKKYFGDTAAPWTDASQSTAGWDSYFEVDRSTARSLFASIDGSGNTTGKGAQNGYISGLGVPSSLALVWNTIQFPRAFSATPSSVTLGVAGPSEANVASIVTANLSAFGCDVRAAYTSSGASCVFQRNYTATQ